MPVYTPKWRFILVNALDLSTIAPLESAKSKTLTLVHNRPGSFSFSISMDDDISLLIKPLTTAVMAWRRNTSGTWQCQWSGKITDVDEDWTAGNVTVQADGWLQHLEKRFMRRIKDFRDMNPNTGMFWTDAEIIFALIDEMNVSNINWQIDQDGNLFNYVIPTPFVGPTGSQPTPVWKGAAVGNFHPNNERRYVVEQRGQALSSITALTDIENGCDIRMNPETRELSVYQQFGVTRQIDFGYRSTPNNLRDFGRNYGTDSVINFEVVSSSQGRIIPQFADTLAFGDPTTDPPKIGENSMKVYGLLEEEQTIAVGAGGQPAATLRTFAASEVLLRSTPRVLYRALPLSIVSENQVGNVPEPFVDYVIGDKVYLTAKRGKRSIDNQLVRVYGLTVSPDDSNGSEIITQMQISL